jgi:hypothetical protein
MAAIERSSDFQNFNRKVPGFRRPGASARRKGLRLLRALQAVEKMTCSVILSEAKNLSLFLHLHLNRREILRFAQNDSVLSFFLQPVQPLELERLKTLSCVAGLSDLKVGPSELLDQNLTTSGSKSNWRNARKTQEIAC